MCQASSQAYTIIFPIVSITKIPTVFKAYEIIENTFIEICLEAAINETPISSGNGEAIIKPATTGIRYFLNIFGVL